MTKIKILLSLAVSSVTLSACGEIQKSADILAPISFPDPVETTYIEGPSKKQMVQEATGRKRVRDLRAEVVGSMEYLQEYLGEHRSYLLDMNDSLLVTLPGAGAFEGRSARLSEAGIDAAAKLAASLQAYPESRLAIVGHVDGTEDAKSDQILSERRAMAVKSVLMQRGVDECRIGLMGKGSDDHVAAPVSERRNQFNNRIEVLIKPIQDGACV